jgi:hypothetical protein
MDSWVHKFGKEHTYRMAFGMVRYGTVMTEMLLGVN